MGMIVEPVQITLLCQTLEVGFGPYHASRPTTCRECGRTFSLWSRVKQHYNLTDEELEYIRRRHEECLEAKTPASFIML